MKAEHLEILVEESSMEAFLRELLPRLLGDEVSFAVYPYQCKDALLSKLPARLDGYAKWLPETWRIMASDAGLRTRTAGAGEQWQVVNRIAIEELEAWYFGDWEAVRAAYLRVQQTVPSQPKYRDPDAIARGTWEAFERVLQKAGYFKGGLRKIEAARSIAAHMVPDRNCSKSFQVLRNALLEMATA
jgi:hypothetical protein